MFTLEKEDSAWLEEVGIIIDNPKINGSCAPHDIEIGKTDGHQFVKLCLKDWQHLGALIRIELVKNKTNGSNASVFAEMPNEQFKRLQ